MIQQFTAEAAIEVGHHEQHELWGYTFNVDTIIATSVAAVIVISAAAPAATSVQAFIMSVTRIVAFITGPAANT